jgi:hypothetical protein
MSRIPEDGTASRVTVVVKTIRNEKIICSFLDGAAQLNSTPLLLDYPRLLFPVTFLLLWAAAWLGRRFRLRGGELPEDLRTDYGTVVGATLTLLGLLIGFTFSMATTRYDARKHFEEEEANAIGTAYVRMDFLPAAAGGRLQTMLRQYLDLRIRYYIIRDRASLTQVNQEIAGLQEQMWKATVSAAQLQPTPLAALASSGMNDVLNAQGYVQAAWWNRIPLAAWALMFLIAVLCNMLLGYGARGKEPVLSVIVPLAVSLSFFLIADIDSPRGGLIRVQPLNLYALQKSLKP